MTILNRTIRRPFEPRAPRPVMGWVGGVRRTRAGRGFTLVEMIVAVAILAVLTTMLVPALFTIDRRKERLGVEEIEDLLTMYAYRDSTGTQPVALAHDPDTGEVSLWVKDIDPAEPEERAMWMPDRFSDPIALPPTLQITSVRLDGRDQPLSGWSITRAPSEPRPVVEIDVVGETITATLILSSTALAPYRVENGLTVGLIRQSVDLDRQGLDRQEW